MISKRNQLLRSKIYVILDKKTLGARDIYKITKKIANKGADIIQLRDKYSFDAEFLKYAQRLKFLLNKNRPLFIINDRLDIAKAVDADGVHLGQKDFPIKEARKILGKDKIIGISCHNMTQALKAQREGADYIGVGPIFATPVKPQDSPVGLNLLRRVSRVIRIPLFAVGGIDENNIHKVFGVRTKGIALCRPVCLAKDPAAVIKNLRAKFVK